MISDVYQVVSLDAYLVVPHVHLCVSLEASTGTKSLSNIIEIMIERYGISTGSKKSIMILMCISR